MLALSPSLDFNSESPEYREPRQDSVDVSVIRLRAGWSETRIPAGVRNIFFLLQNAQTSSGPTQPSSEWYQHSFQRLTLPELKFATPNHLTPRLRTRGAAALHALLACTWTTLHFLSAYEAGEICARMMFVECCVQ
jgi:hypothetical protein